MEADHIADRYFNISQGCKLSKCKSELWEYPIPRDVHRIEISKWSERKSCTDIRECNYWLAHGCVRKDGRLESVKSVGLFESWFSSGLFYNTDKTVFRNLVSSPG